MRPRRTKRTETRAPRPQYHRVTINRAHPLPSLECVCLELMHIAVDAKRHGLPVLGIAALPTPRIYTINPEA